METYLSIRKAAAILGVSIATLRRWDADGKLVAVRTPGGQRRYTETQLREFFKPTQKLKADMAKLEANFAVFKKILDGLAGRMEAQREEEAK